MPISPIMKNLRDKVGNDLLMMPAAGGVVINNDGDVLLQLRSDNELWGIPGGALDPGEDIADCVVREILEETGITVAPERITSVLAGEEFFHAYPNGDRVAIISIMTRCRPLSGEPKINDDESLAIRYFSPDALPENIIPRHRFMVEKALENPDYAFFRYDENKVNTSKDDMYIKQLRQKVGTDLIMSAGAVGVVLNDNNEILLQQRSDTRTWGLPGGAIDPGEDPAETVVREVYEEAGIHVVPERILSVLSGDDYLHTYPDGNQVAIMSITFQCRWVSGTPKVNDNESLAVKFFPIDALPEAMIPRHRFRIETALKNFPHTYFNPPSK